MVSAGVGGLVEVVISPYTKAGHEFPDWDELVRDSTCSRMYHEGSSCLPKLIVEYLGLRCRVDRRIDVFVGCARH